MTTRLPVVGSTAATTSFCSERLDGLGGTFIYLDGNSKITASNGDFANPRPNAFSLRAQAVTDKLEGIAFAGEDCPGSTPTCRAACYVGGIDEHQRDIYAMYEHNSEAIREILADELLANDWVMRMAHWITQNAPGGFRLHVSGDLFSMQYAEWLADLCRESAPVRVWTYTRSFDFIAPLVGVSTINGGNLALNLSADQDNYELAKKVRATWEQPDGRLRICYLTVDGIVPDDLDSDDVVFPDYSLRLGITKFEDSMWWQSLSKFDRGLCCPVDVKGKNERVRCGLNNCDRCLR